ncbi:Acg family FMN-binding oxidoreductase [Amorphoplanes digitatis]|uniref:Nitroreductase n=1 Tax=Actinoplanes digitatis TaxID=1868 RepID=A0A7W7I1Q2_9ACTN|nr:nitroreductase [Actinoplanes digitatis]MBB4764785.1 nitroreductase [Actinoplanes digitatis]BFE74361.1 NAD(P)H nitroreductase [Actinoplanes digitatis]GID91262.1 NAD(P)H nitroreductase [Actinoplanes digitatis]
MNADANAVIRAEARVALESAARSSLRAPSVFNTQPWKWRVAGDVAELFSDSARRLGATDAEGRLLLLSCGGALHHARIALAAQGWCAEVDRLPDDRRPDLLARIRVTGRGAPDPVAAGLAASVSRRRTDRRAFGERRPSDDTLARLGRLVEAEGARLHEVPDERVPTLAMLVDQAADVEYFDPAYRSELTRWTHRPAWTGDGVPPATAVQNSLRRVPVRNLLPSGSAGLLAGAGDDEGAVYAILYGAGDRPLNLLCGGEAMSALLLGATAEGLATAPISEAVEVAWPRRLLRRLLPDTGEPFLIVRLGYVDSDEVLPVSPRRAAHDAIQVED